MAEQAGGTRRRCAADTSGAQGSRKRSPCCVVPAPGRHAGPGRPGAPPGGHYGSPARSWLTIAMRKHRRKRGPGSKNAAAGRREARRSASWAGDLRALPEDRLDREAGHRVRRSAPAPVGALLPSFSFGERKRTKGTRRPPKKPDGGALAQQTNHKVVGRCACAKTAARGQ